MKLFIRLVSTLLMLSVAASSVVAQTVLNANAGPSNNGGSANWAMFFDLTATSTNSVLVTHLTTASTSAAGAGFSVQIFTRTGTSLGGPVASGPGSSSLGWTSLGTVPATQGATTNGVSLLIDIPDILVSPGNITGVAMQFSVAGPRYFGTGSPPIETYSDGFLQLQTGDARTGPFTTTGSFFSSRALVGSLTYSVVAVPEPTTIALTGLSLAGLAGYYFHRRRRLNHIGQAALSSVAKRTRRS